jgi:hypothetical protein
MYGMGEWMYWLACVGILVLMSALIYLAWWALFSDRSRGRRRCPRCWYDMAHAPPPGITCAECGFVARRERQFHRTRRRYAIASGAILLNVAVAMIITERSMQRGFQALLPSRVLIWMLPIADNPRDGMLGELIYRATRSDLSEGQWKSFMARCATGDWRARPIDDAWRRKYGDLITSFRAMMIYEPHIEEPLLSIPPEVQVTSRDAWPLGAPVTVTMQILDWWPLGTECRVRVAPRLEGVDSVTVYRSASDRWPRTPFALHLPPLDPTTQEIVVDVHLDRRRLLLAEGGSSEPVGDWEPVMDKRVRLPVRFEGSVETSAQAVSDKAMNAAMGEVFENGIVEWEEGQSPVRFNVAAPITFSPTFAKTAVGLRAELLCDGVVARRLNMWWLGGVRQGRGDYDGRNYGFEIDYEDVALLSQLQAGDELRRWQMRIVGDPLIALRAGKAEKYWAGEVVLPVQLSSRRGDAPPRPWRREE